MDAPGLARFLEAALGHAPSPWPLREWDLRRLTLAAIYFQPSLDVARAHAAVAGAAVESAGARPNPTLAIAPEYSVNPMGAVSPWVTAVHLDWVLETAGKRAWRIERATADADASRAAITIETWRVRRQLASALVVLATARRQAAALADEVRSEERLVALIEARLRRADTSLVSSHFGPLGDRSRSRPKTSGSSSITWSWDRCTGAANRTGRRGIDCCW